MPDSLQNKSDLLNRSESLLLHADSLNQAVGDRYTTAFIYKNLHALYKAQGNYVLAVAALERFVNANDSIFSEESNAMIEALGKQREEDKKLKQIELQQVRLDALDREKYFYLAGLVAMLLFAASAVFLYRRADRALTQSDSLLLNILPHHTANELKEHGHSEARHYPSASVLFTDFVDFSKLSKRLPAKELVALIDHYYKGFDRIVKKHGLEKIKTIGDAYMAACGVPIECDDHAIKCIRAAFDINRFVEMEARWRAVENKPFFFVRIGINSGSLVAGIVGDSKFAYDIWGDTVNLASRMESASEPGRINISGTTRDLVKDLCICQHRGQVKVKHGVEIDMFYVVSMVTEPAAVPA